jgi:hypothetical protein
MIDNPFSKKVAELREALSQAEAQEAAENEVRKLQTPPRFRYTIRPDSRNAFFDKMYDSTCLRYIIRRACLNEFEARAAGHHNINGGQMVYIFNTVTSRIICSVGGGTSYIVSSYADDGADDQAFTDIGQFLKSNPNGGVITTIVDEFRARRGLDA